MESSVSADAEMCESIHIKGIAVRDISYLNDDVEGWLSNYVPGIQFNQAGVASFFSGTQQFFIHLSLGRLLLTAILDVEIENRESLFEAALVVNWRQLQFQGGLAVNEDDDKLYFCKSINLTGLAQEELHQCLDDGLDAVFIALSELERQVFFSNTRKREELGGIVNQQAWVKNTRVLR
ncbi:type III secretion system chaperone [Chromobacterium sp. IIBBL 290-4]|uniref:type III secretion system chaperone n=1 Tax=Chromobacterium sp. IIBBL 290-4 TaxID=2953890 RepID=UPI0020B87491|nr:type III secretion system chaperone [Chromobacterium sp. IIBBL 290-4]UTH74112.1 type III secretion system chaperone [Chromobacterium sp. IIBBL 290-4]